MSDNQTLNHDSPAVLGHLQIVQGVIQRMAENSRSCKVWCVTLVSAILVLVAQTKESQHALIALAPIALFWLLDSYYLTLERGFRESYNALVGKVHDGQLRISDLFEVIPGGSTARGFFSAMFTSPSTLPFYLVVIATVLLAWRLVL